ncbi:MAG: DUF4430 domain-containing protein [Clostridia bacterium]|nr:DUF4430 domain-containing protein [Clostridia bacterium]
MTTRQLKKALSVILCAVLIAAMALMTIGCSNDAGGNEEMKAEFTENPMGENNGDGEMSNENGGSAESNADEGARVLGEGKNRFDFNVVDIEGNVTQFVINTDKDVVGEALLELGLIKGDAGPYGLYVKEVNGIVADYDKDKTYWGFYVDGEYAMTGVDMTNVEAGKVYSFKVSK